MMSSETQDGLTADEARSRISAVSRSPPNCGRRACRHRWSTGRSTRSGQSGPGRGWNLKYRSLVVCTTLAVLNRLDKLEVHLAGALRQGWTADELAEAMLQMTAYAGVAAGTDAYAALAKAVAVVEREAVGVAQD